MGRDPRKGRRGKGAAPPLPPEVVARQATRAREAREKAVYDAQARAETQGPRVAEARAQLAAVESAPRTDIERAARAVARRRAALRELPARWVHKIAAAKEDLKDARRALAHAEAKRIARETQAREALRVAVRDARQIARDLGNARRAYQAALTREARATVTTHGPSKALGIVEQKRDRSEVRESYQRTTETVPVLQHAQGLRFTHANRAFDPAAFTEALIAHTEARVEKWGPAQGQDRDTVSGRGIAFVVRAPAGYSQDRERAVSRALVPLSAAGDLAVSVHASEDRRYASWSVSIESASGRPLSADDLAALARRAAPVLGAVVDALARSPADYDDLDWWAGEHLDDWEDFDDYG